MNSLIVSADAPGQRTWDRGEGDGCVRALPDASVCPASAGPFRADL